MIEIGLKYLGRKAPFTLSPAYLQEPINIPKVSDFVFWVPESIAQRLQKDNPRMFQVVGERGQKKPVLAEMPEVLEPIDIFENMTKREIEQYAHDEFGIDLDMRLSRANLLKQIRDLAIERFIAEEKEEDVPAS